MHHTLSFVAESRRIEPVAFKEFALANVDKYGLVLVEGRVPEVGTWYVDQLVSDFRASIKTGTVINSKDSTK